MKKLIEENDSIISLPHLLCKHNSSEINVTSNCSQCEGTPKISTQAKLKLHANFAELTPLQRIDFLLFYQQFIDYSSLKTTLYVDVVRNTCYWYRTYIVRNACYWYVCCTECLILVRMLYGMHVTGTYVVRNACYWDVLLVLYVWQ